MAMLLNINTSWPVWGGCILMLLGAAIERATRRVPNALTLPAIFLGLLVAFAFGKGGLSPRLEGDIGASFGVASLTLVVLAVGWRARIVGGGSAKIQTAFGAWIGCALPFNKAVLLASAAIVSVVWVCLLADLFVQWNPPLMEEDGPHHVRFTQMPVSVITVATVLALALMGSL
jgi:prepilin signal peptidase PulO-like enzyme (type II secretory pathway)